MDNKIINQAWDKVKKRERNRILVHFGYDIMKRINDLKIKSIKECQDQNGNFAVLFESNGDVFDYYEYAWGNIHEYLDPENAFITEEIAIKTTLFDDEFFNRY